MAIKEIEPAPNLGPLEFRVAALEDEVQSIRQIFQGRGTEKTPGVCGGSARIVRTRIAVWTLESLRRKGMSEASMLASYPSLTAFDLVSAWAYVEANKAEIDSEIRENEAD